MKGPILPPQSEALVEDWSRLSTVNSDKVDVFLDHKNALQSPILANTNAHGLMIIMSSSATSSLGLIGVFP